MHIGQVDCYVLIMNIYKVNILSLQSCKHMLYIPAYFGLKKKKKKEKKAILVLM